MSSGPYRIVVLIDGRHTREVTDVLAKLIPLETAEVLLVFVAGEDPRAGLDLVSHRPGRHDRPPDREQGIDEAERAGGAEALEEAERLVGPHAASVRALLERGRPGHLVCEIAARERADLVVVRAGTADRPPIGPHSLGPAAKFITDHSPCPVLLLR